MRYEIVGESSRQLVGLFRDFDRQQRRFPLFYERKKTQYLIGFLRMYCKSTKSTQNRACDICISFSNFCTLNTIIKSHQQRTPIPQHQYISSLPTFYHKFLKYYLPNLNVNLSQQSSQLFENIHNKPIGITNMRFYQQKMAEKSRVTIEERESFEKHRKKISECCAIYSEGGFEEWEEKRGKFYQQTRQVKAVVKGTCVTQFFKKQIEKLTKQYQSTSFPNDYLTPSSNHSTSMKRQLQKYSNIRRNDQQTDQLVGGLFGNPFRKINKKVKLYDEAQSVWVEPQQVETMKQLLNKQMEVYKQMLADMSQGQKDEVENILKNTESIYDKLAGVKGIIAEALKNVQKLQKTNTLADQAIPQDTSLKKDTFLQNNDMIPQPYSTNQQNESSHKLQQNNEKILSEQSQLEQPTQQLSEELQKQLYNFQQEQAKPTRSNVTDPRIIQRQFSNKSQQQIQNNESKMKEQIPKLPEIIQEINSKFSMIKSAFLEIPSRLIHNELYLRNRAIISEALLNHLGLGGK